MNKDLHSKLQRESASARGANDPRESERHYRLLFENNPQPMWVFDSETLAFLEVNDAAVIQYGYSRDEFLSMTIKDIRPAEDVSKLSDYKARSRNGFGSYDDSCHWRHQRKDGRLIDVEVIWHTLEFDGRPAKLVLAQDVTERRKTGAEIRYQQSLFHQLLANAPLGILQVDQNDRIVDANKEFQAMFQYSLDEVRGRHINDTIVPENDLDSAMNLSAITLRGEPIRSDAQRRRKDGSLVPVEIFGAPIIIDGQTVGVFAIYTDLTEHKQAEAALLASERRYRDIFTFAPVGIYQSLADGTITAANIALAEMLGCESVDEVRKLNLAKDVYVGEQERRELTAEYEARGYARDLQIQWKKKDGSIIWVELSAHAVKGPTGRTEYFEGFVHDITERKRMEDERQVITEIIQGISDTSDLNDLLVLIHQSIAKYLYAENCFVALYDEDTKLMEFPFWVDQLDPRPEPRPIGVGFSSYVLRTGKSMLVDPELTQLMYERGEVEKSGSTSTSWMGVPLRTPTRSIGVLVVQHYEEENLYDQRDLEFLTSVGNQIALAIERKRAETNLRAAEERLRQSQKMESIGNLAGGIAHDFNNLMTAVIGYSELALNSLQNNDSLRFKIEEIKKAGERAANLTRQLLAFSRKQMLQPRVLNINKIILEMDKLLRRLIGEDVIFQTRLDPLLGEVKADPGQIEQVLMNLVVNARDAMPTGGHLTIETQNIQVDRPLTNRRETLQTGHYVLLSVSDDGCGMDADTQERIFEPFFTTKEVGKGTGLGLATVYGIVRQSEAYIWVYSEVGKGTSFKIYLPRVDVAPEATDVSEVKQPARGGQGTILLVEDEVIVRDLAREVLQYYGYKVITAENGEEGLRVCREFAGQIDLVLTDVVMPRMSGRELAEQLAVERPGTRVLYMSGFTDDAIVRHGLLEEDIAFIQKPFTPESLATKIRDLLDNVN